MSERGEDFALEVGTNFAKIIWSSGSRTMVRNLVRGPEQVRRAAVIIAHRMAPEVEAYAKVNAPWTDRTGNARNGLAARPFEEGDSVGIDVFHQVSYGIWLEVAHGGKYAIIMPTVDAMGPKVMAQYENLLGRL